MTYRWNVPIDEKFESQIQISYGSVYRMRTDSHCGAQHKWLCAVRL